MPTLVLVIVFAIVPTLTFYDSFHFSIMPTLAIYDSFHSSIVPTSRRNNNVSPFFYSIRLPSQTIEQNFKLDPERSRYQVQPVGSDFAGMQHLDDFRLRRIGSHGDETFKIPVKLHNTHGLHVVLLPRRPSRKKYS